MGVISTYLVQESESEIVQGELRVCEESEVALFDAGCLVLEWRFDFTWEGYSSETAETMEISSSGMPTDWLSYSQRTLKVI